MEPGGFDMQQIFAAAQQALSAQQEIANSEVTGTAGGGAVRAVVSGAGELLELTIEPSVIDTADPEETAVTVADLVLAAVRDASRAAADLQQRQLGALGGVPGLDLSGLGLPGPGTGRDVAYADDDDYDDEDDDDEYDDDDEDDDDDDEDDDDEYDDDEEDDEDDER